MERRLRLAVVCWAALLDGAVGKAPRTLPLPEVEFGELLSAEPLALLRLHGALVEYGGFALSNVPRLADAIREALGALPSCAPHGGGDEEASVGGARPWRTTVAAATTAGVVLPPDAPACARALAPLRALVAAATDATLGGVDAGPAGALRLARDGGGSYASLRLIAAAGEQLEHFHTYPVPNATRADAANAAAAADAGLAGAGWTMPLHTDTGMFAIMTPGFYHSPRPAGDPPRAHAPEFRAPPLSRPDGDDGGSRVVSGGLYLKLRSGELVRVAQAAPEAAVGGALIVLAGEGAARWLRSAADAPALFRAAPHALRVGVATPSDLNPGGSPLVRGWHGRMLLPPADALLPSGARFDRTRADEAAALTRARADGADGVAGPASGGRPCATHDDGGLRHDGGLMASLLPPGAATFVAAPVDGADAGEDGGDGGGFSSSAAAAAAAAASAAAEVAPWHTASGRRLNLLVAPGSGGECLTSSGRPGHKCWTVCMDASALRCAPSRVQCLDSVTDTVVDGFKMCPSAPMTTSCHLRCAPELQPPSPPALAPPPPAAAAAGGEPADAPGRFCVGPGTVMYMEGFAWSTFGTRRGGHGGGRARPECVSFLFRGWALDSRAKFGAGCAGCVLLGLLAEGIALLRVYVHDASALTDAAADGRGGGARGRWRGWRRGAALGCHCAQLVVGYLLMLVVMSFSYELFAAAVGGLTLGHALTERARERAGGGGGGGTLDPCCPQPPASEARGRSGAYDEILPASVVVRLGDVAHADEAADRPLMLAGTPRSSEPSDWPHAAQPPPRSRAQPTSSSAAASTTVEFAVRGMVCGRCTARVSAALADALAAAGVTDVSVHVNLESERALLLGSVHRLRALRTAELSAAVVAQGYECSVMAEPGMAATMGE